MVVMYSTGDLFRLRHYITSLGLPEGVESSFGANLVNSFV